MTTGTNASQLRMARGRVRRIFSAVTLALLTLGVAASSSAAEIVGASRPNVEREGHAATRLRKGAVLLVDGRNASGVTEDVDTADSTALGGGSILIHK